MVFLLDSGITNHSVCDKTLFIKGKYKEKPSFLEIRYSEKLISKRLGSLLVPLENKKREKIGLIFTNILYLSLLRYNRISTCCPGKERIENFLWANKKPSQLIFNGEIFRLPNLINKHSIIRIYKKQGIQPLITMS